MMITTAKYAATLAALAGATILLAACGSEGQFSSMARAMGLLGYGPAVLHNALVGKVAGSGGGDFPDEAREEDAGPWIAAAETRHFEVYSNYVAYLAQTEFSGSGGGGKTKPSTQAEETGGAERAPLRHCDPRFVDNLHRQ